MDLVTIADAFVFCCGGGEAHLMAQVANVIQSYVVSQSESVAYTTE